MGYGIRIESGNGSLQIDSDTTNVGTIITDVISSSSEVTYDPETQLVFARPASGTGVSIAVGLSTGTTTNGDGTVTRTFRTPSGNNSLVSMEILLVEFANNLTASTTGYGIQIFNSSNELAFDSEALGGDGGFNITDYFPRGTQDGQGLTKLTTDPFAFAVFNNTGIDANEGGLYRGFSFDDNNQGTDGVAYFGYLDINVAELGGFISSYFQNWSAILLGERGAG